MEFQKISSIKFGRTDTAIGMIFSSNLQPGWMALKPPIYVDSFDSVKFYMMDESLVDWLGHMNYRQIFSLFTISHFYDTYKDKVPIPEL